MNKEREQDKMQSLPCKAVRQGFDDLLESYSGRIGDAYLDGCTPAQRAVLEPPYNNRLERPSVVKGGDEEPNVEARSAAKKAFDRIVFGTDYS